MHLCDITTTTTTATTTAGRADPLRRPLQRPSARPCKQPNACLCQNTLTLKEKMTRINDVSVLCPRIFFSLPAKTPLRSRLLPGQTRPRPLPANQTKRKEDSALLSSPLLCFLCEKKRKKRGPSCFFFFLSPTKPPQQRPQNQQQASDVAVLLPSALQDRVQCLPFVTAL